MEESATRMMNVSKRISGPEDMDHWKKCKGYHDIMSFIKQMNEFAKGMDTLHDLSRINFPILKKTLEFMGLLRKLVDQVKPIEHDPNQRFGNKAFRNWHEEMQKKVEEFLNENFGHHDALELKPYMTDSFGNPQRLDYGTGHELNFVIYLMGLYKLVLNKDDSADKDSIKSMLHQCLGIFGFSYLPLVRNIQMTYRLEPAGSHGVYSLDDYQFLPFYFGSSQLSSQAILEPRDFPEVEVATLNADRYMFHAAVHFIHTVKTGPFFEHSNQLWNISGVESWSKINSGLLKMFVDEVMNEFPIVQHLVFGDNVLLWKY